MKEYSPIYLTATFIVKSEMIFEAKRIFANIVQPSLNESGCIIYDLFQDAEDAQKFIFIEKWIDQSSLDAHLNAPHILAIQPDLEKILDRPLSIQWLNKIVAHSPINV